MDDNSIKVSIVVRVVGGGKFLARLLDNLINQVSEKDTEILVCYDSSIEEIKDLEPIYSQVAFIDIGVIPMQAKSGTYFAKHEKIDRLTAFSLSQARGGIICLLEDYDIPATDWYKQVLEAHKLPHGVIGGAIEHAGTGALNWAVYFLDFGRYQQPVEEGRVAYLSDANTTYKSATINRVNWLWKDRYNEASVHWELAEQGEVLWKRPQIVVRQDRGELRFWELLKERFDWGKTFSLARVKKFSPIERLMYIIASPAIVLVLLGRITWKVFNSRRNRMQLLRSYPALVILAIAWTLGELAGYLTQPE